MARLTVKNIGPIKDIDIELKKVNVFIGLQGCGKSTLAKIISFCSWLEKNKLEMSNKDVLAKGVINNFQSFYRLKGYFSESSQIYYRGDNIHFIYNSEFSEDYNNTDIYSHQYHFRDKEHIFFKISRTINPKVIYIPAERSFIAAVPELKKYANSNDYIKSFIDSWFEAKRKYEKENPIPIIDQNISFFSSDDQDYLKLENGDSIELSAASSGLQSVTPLIVLTKWLAEDIYKEEEPFSIEEKDAIKRLLKDASTETDSQEIIKLRNRLLGFLQGNVYSHTQFIIEEPELSLFPTAQCSFINYMASVIGHGKKHRMVLTTHSPYIISYLNVLMRRPQGMVNLNAEDIGVYLIHDGEIQNLLLHNNSRSKWMVDTSILTDVMRNIYDEFAGIGNERDFGK